MKTILSIALSFVILACSAAAVEPGLPAEAKSVADRATQEYKTGKYRESAKDFAQAVKLSGDTCFVCLEGQAMATAQFGEEKDSLKLADRAIAMAKDNQQKAAAHFCKGDICTLFGNEDPRRLSDAEVEYRNASDLLPNSADVRFRLGLTLLREKKDAEGTERLQSFLTLEPSGHRADLARKLIANPRHAGLTFAPEFSFKTVQGNKIDNAATEGRVVVFDFWATWCPPCRASVPEIRELSKKYGDKVRIISVSADEKEKDWSDFIAKKNMDWDQYRDADETIRKAFAVHAFPTYIVLDKDGAIVQRITGMDPQQTIVSRLRDELKKMLD